MKYSLKNQYRHLLKEEDVFSFFYDNEDDGYFDEDDDELNLNSLQGSPDKIQVFPSKKMVARNSNLRGKKFIYKVRQADLNRLGSPGNINISFDKIIEFGRLDNINTSLKNEYVILSSDIGKNTSVFTVALKFFFQSFEAVYLNRALSAEEDAIDFNDASTIKTIKANYINSIKSFLNKNKNFSKPSVKVTNSFKTFLNTFTNHPEIKNYFLNKTIEHNKNDQNDYVFIKEHNKDVSFFDKLYELFQKEKDTQLFSYSIENLSNRDFTSVKKREIASLILSYYTNELYIEIDDEIENSNIRKKVNDIKTVINELNKSEFAKKSLTFDNANRIGPGEFICHLLFKTKNALLDIEPDVIFDFNGGKTSVKSFRSVTVMSGTNMKPALKKAIDDFYSLILKNNNISTGSWSSKSNVWSKLDNFNEANINDFNAFSNSIYSETVLTSLLGKKVVNQSLEDATQEEKKESQKKILSLWNLVKYHTIFEHDAEIILCTDEKKYGNEPFYFLEKKSIDLNKIDESEELKRVYISNCRNNRVSFRINKSAVNTQNLTTIFSRVKSLTERKNNILKNILLEGGKAGHMMHPYENLHMKISDMKRMIENFQNDFEISEKVDGANLFFTITDQGKVMFSRNKSDMSYQETLDKFGPEHPAHILFNEGAKSIFNAIQRSLDMQEINQIFGQHPEGGKTYINFEIMHPQKPNQIKYDMKYIVFHAIVDYDVNGDKVLSSPDDNRLLILIEKLQPYFNTHDNDFNLGSNFKIKLNNLSSEDVDELHSQLENITTGLGISDDMTIADAVKSEIKTLLDRENILSRLSEDKIEMIYDFITNESSTVKGTQIKKGLDKDIQKSLVELGLTSKTKAYKVVKKVISEFKPLFILLGIKLLHNVQSRYMSSDASEKNVDELKSLLVAAIEDYDEIIASPAPSNKDDQIAKSLTPHIANVRHYGIDNVVSSPVEGGVFIGHDGNTYKVTGGFAPLNQILGTAMRNLDSMPRFKQEFLNQERGS